MPYEKGFTFLYYLEREIGREKWDKFIPHVRILPIRVPQSSRSCSWGQYFSTFARRSLDSYEFKSCLLEYFSSDSAASTFLETLDWDTWYYAPGLPPKPDYDTSLVDTCYALASKWEKLANGADSTFKPRKEDIADMRSSQVVVFLERLQESEKPLGKDKVKLMDKSYGFGGSGNAEILSRFLEIALKAQVEELYEVATRFLGEVGRMKFVRPL